ncbi:MAG: hypothetical protein ACJAXZ_001382 [Akkermansiaceae bacterium]|jgi:hypothetical protein
MGAEGAFEHVVGTLRKWQANGKQANFEQRKRSYDFS